MTEPEFTDTARSALLWVLWHHQGGSSKVGQPLRFALGMGAHDRLSERQVEEARRWGELHAVAQPSELTPELVGRTMRAMARVITDEQIDTICAPGRASRWKCDGRQYDRDTVRLVLAPLADEPTASQASAPQVVEPTGNPVVDAWSGPVLLDAATPQASAPSVQVVPPLTDPAGDGAQEC
jgi:hypothetical protein